MKDEQTEKLYHSITDIDPAYIEEAKEPIKRRRPAAWKTWGAMAACLCLIGAGIFAGTRWSGITQPTLDPGSTATEPTEPQPTTILTTREPGSLPTPSLSHTGSPQSTPTLFLLPYNEIGEPPQAEYAMISLSGEDFRPMDTQEALDYFGINLPADNTLAGLPLTAGDCMGQGLGRFETAERGVYFDANSFTFSAEGKRIILTARTVFTHMLPTSAQVAAGPEEMALTEINGWHLVLFRYPDESGTPLVYAEFALGDTVCSLSAAGLTDDEFAEALEQLLPAKESPADGITGCTGTVLSVDSRTEDSFDGAERHVSELHDWIELDCSGTRLTVWLLGTADAFQAGDQVSLSYRGEPATAYSIWPGQLVSVEKVG